MALEIVTKEDLQEFKNDLLQELKTLLLPKSNNQSNGSVAQMLKHSSKFPQELSKHEGLTALSVIL